MTGEFHDHDCGDIGGGWPHPASAHDEKEGPPMTNEKEGPRSNDEYLIAAFGRSIDNIALDLRRLADEVERKKRISTRIARPYLSNAEGVVQSILNCLPGLNLGLLMERAHDCETLIEGSDGQQ